MMPERRLIEFILRAEANGLERRLVGEEAA
jgi:hypothetical protein